MEAKYPSDCGVCGQKINVGDDQQSMGGGMWRHEGCAAPSQAEHDTQDSRDEPPAASLTEATPERAEGDERQPHSVPEPAALPSMPAGATAEQLRAWLHEVEAQELAIKREEHLVKVRPARSKLIEELFAHHDVAPVAGDRSETRRLRALRNKLLGDDAKVQRPEWHDESLAEPIRFAAKPKPRRHVVQDGDADHH